MPTFSYDPATNIGKVRILISDTDLSAVGVPEDRTSWSCKFSDDEITAFLSISNSNYVKAAALALRSIATSKALLIKHQKVTVGTTTFDHGNAVANLLQQAESLEKAAARNVAPAAIVGGPINSEFDLAEIFGNSFLRGTYDA